MIRNQGFLVQYDRFSLVDPCEYILKGYLAPGTELSATLLGVPQKVEVHTMTENTDERYGGCETRAILHLPEELFDGNRRRGAAGSGAAGGSTAGGGAAGGVSAGKGRKRTAAGRGGELRIYADGEGGKRLAFAISVKELEQKRKPIRIYLDDFAVSAKDGYVRIQGWAVAKKPVAIRIFDRNGKRIMAAAERYRRFDTVELFDEYPVTPDNGFHIELRPIPEEKVYVRFETEDCRITRAFPTGQAGYQAARASRLMKKGMNVLRFNGPGELWNKTYNRLFNPAMKQVVYADWIRKHLPSERELAKERKNTALMEGRPLISVVVPCYRTPENYLRELTESVVNQSYDRWELILSDGSGADSPIEGVLKELERGDGRIRAIFHNEKMNISMNTNAAIEEAKGDYVLFADHDDLLAPNALYEIACAAMREDSDLIYTDEDKIGIGEKYMQPNMKPDFDPDLLCSVNYMCHIVCVRRAFLDEVGPLDPAYDGAQDHDFLLRAVERTDRITHIPKVLYHWRFFEGSTAANPESKRYAFEAGRRAVQAHYDRLGYPATAHEGEYPGLIRTTWNWKEEPLVSVLIPNKDHIKDLRKCLDSIARCSTWPNLEILIIENNSEEAETFAFYKEMEEADPRIRVLFYKGGFNFSAINNFGVKEAHGDYLLFLNNDVEFISDVIREMMGFGLRPDVGAVGARLYYGDDTVQHAGVIIGWGGVAGHAFVNQKRGDTGYQHRIICQQDMSAVTAACMLVRSEVFRGIGGFTEELAVAFNDIDLCMKIRRAGYLIVYNPYAEAYHYESRSRGLENTPEKVRRFNKESQYFAKCWPEILRDGDPYYSPNLSMVTQDFSLKHI